jgi:hypothetical protein
MSRRSRLVVRHLKRCQQRYYSKLFNTIHATSRAFGFFSAPFIVVGDPKFKASMPGQRAAPTKRTVDELSRHFLVFVIDENNTSQVCPWCHCHMTQTEEWKLKRCSNADCVVRNRDGVGVAGVGGGGAGAGAGVGAGVGGGGVGGGGVGGGGVGAGVGGGGGAGQFVRRVLDRDFAATLNLLDIFMSLVLTGWRPVVFRKGFSAVANLKVDAPGLSQVELARRRSLASSGGMRPPAVDVQF